MRPVRCSACFRVVMLALGCMMACGPAVNAQEPPVVVPTPVQVSPPAAEQEPLLVVAERMLAGDLAALDALDEPRRIALLRAALFSTQEDIARRAASRLKWTHLDARECSTVGYLLFPAVLTGAEGASMEEWRSLLGSAEVPRILASWREWPRRGTDIKGFIGILHRALRSEDLGLLLGIVMDKDSGDIGRWVMEEVAATVLPHTDANRGRVATALMHYAGRAPPAARPADAKGLDPRLQRLLELVASKGPSALPRGSHGFLARWVRESGAIEADIPCLAACTAMARQDPALGPLFGLACIRAGAEVQGAAATRWFESLVADEGLIGLEALAALARRGDAASRTALMRRAESNTEALAHLVLADAGSAESLLLRLMNTAPATESRALAQQLGNIADASEELMLPSAAGVVAKSIELCVKKGRRAAVIARAGSRYGELATRERALAALKALATEGPEALGAPDTLEGLGDWAFIESRARTELLSLLARWRSEPAHRALATELLLRVGGPTDATAVMAADDELQERALQALPEAERILVRAAADGIAGDEAVSADALARAMRWLGLFGGLPFEVAGSVAEAEMPMEVHALVLTALREGRAADALVAALPHLANGKLHGLGKVRDERVLAFLHDLATQRETRLHAFATGELVRAGSLSASDELRRVISDGRYRWLDDEEGAILSFGLDPAEAPHWIQELESNCCRAVVARRVLEDLFGWELPRTADALVTDATFARRWHAASGGHFAWSVIAQHWLPAP